MPCDSATSPFPSHSTTTNHVLTPHYFLCKTIDWDGDCGCQSAWLVYLLPSKFPLK